MDPAKYSAKPRRNANAHRSVRHDFPPSPLPVRAASERARHPLQNRRSVSRVHYGWVPSSPLVYWQRLLVAVTSAPSSQPPEPSNSCGLGGSYGYSWRPKSLTPLTPLVPPKRYGECRKVEKKLRGGSDFFLPFTKSQAPLNKGVKGVKGVKDQIETMVT